MQTAHPVALLYGAGAPSRVILSPGAADSVDRMLLEINRCSCRTYHLRVSRGRHLNLDTDLGSEVAIKSLCVDTGLGHVLELILAERCG